MNSNCIKEMIGIAIQINIEINNLHAPLRRITIIIIGINDNNLIERTNIIKEQATLLQRETIPPATISTTNKSLIGERNYEKLLTIILMIENIVKEIG